MKKFVFGVVLGSVAFASQANAEAVKSMLTASNGVEVTVYSDDFEGRYEFTAPAVRVGEIGGTSAVALVARVLKTNVDTGTHVTGFVSYSGSWKFFEGAVFKGGEKVDFTRTDGKVGSCRYGCSLTESFNMKITPAQLSKYAENGMVPVQIRARSTDTILLSLPVSYFQAMNEMKKP